MDQDCHECKILPWLYYKKLEVSQNFWYLVSFQKNLNINCESLLHSQKANYQKVSITSTNQNQYIHQKETNSTDHHLSIQGKLVCAQHSQPLCIWKQEQLFVTAYQVKSDYTSESESERPRKMAELAPRKFEGIGPTTKDGMPIVLRSVSAIIHQN